MSAGAGYASGMDPDGPVQPVVRVAKALSDPTRVRILAALGERALCVCELTCLFACGQPAVSRHLGILRDAGLVEDVRDGKWVNYRLRARPAEPFARDALRALRRRLAALEEFREAVRSLDRVRICNATRNATGKSTRNPTPARRK